MEPFGRSIPRKSSSFANRNRRNLISKSRYSRKFGVRLGQSLLFILSFGYSGLISKRIPGTIGSLFATMLVLVLPRSYELLLPVAISLFVGGSVCSHLYIIKYRYESNRDPGYVVIDEACGIVLGAIILYTFGFDSVLSIIINFVLFRLFDIFKPFPIGKLEALLKKYDKSVGIGIMVDDVVAAIMASTIQIIGESTTWV